MLDLLVNLRRLSISLYACLLVRLSMLSLFAVSSCIPLCLTSCFSSSQVNDFVSLKLDESLTVPLSLCMYGSVSASVCVSLCLSAFYLDLSLSFSVSPYTSFCLVVFALLVPLAHVFAALHIKRRPSTLPFVPNALANCIFNLSTFFLVQ